jgi:biopolymer transport protein TolQ
MNMYLSSLAHWPLANILYSFEQSNTPGRVIVLMLFFGSIYAWTIMITKYLDLRRAESSSRRFLLNFRKEVNPITLYVRDQMKFGDSPMYEIYVRGCAAVGAELESLGQQYDDLFAVDLADANKVLNHHQFEGVRNVTERNLGDQTLLLERRMGMLGTAVSASPSLGLLGTVWGVMDTFTGMAEVGSASLSAVAPGISGALVTTVMGLMVALPSSVGYNYLAERIARLQLETSNFSKEFVDRIQSHFLKAA